MAISRESLVQQSDARGGYAWVREHADGSVEVSRIRYEYRLARKIADERGIDIVQF